MRRLTTRRSLSLSLSLSLALWLFSSFFYKNPLFPFVCFLSSVSSEIRTLLARELNLHLHEPPASTANNASHLREAQFIDIKKKTRLWGKFSRKRSYNNENVIAKFTNTSYANYCCSNFERLEVPIRKRRLTEWSGVKYFSQWLAHERKIQVHRCEQRVWTNATRVIPP